MNSEELKSNSMEQSSNGGNFLKVEIKEEPTLFLAVEDESGRDNFFVDELSNGDADVTVSDDIKAEIRHIKQEIQYISERQQDLINGQDQIVRILEETNNLLKRNLGILPDMIVKRFPLNSELDMEKLNEELRTDKKFEIITLIKKLLAGNINSNINKIFHKDVIMSYNYDGTKGKKSLKMYKEIVNALFDANSCEEGKTYENFLNELRTSFRLLKNRCHKQDSRNKNKNLNKRAIGDNGDIINGGECKKANLLANYNKSFTKT